MKQYCKVYYDGAGNILHLHTQDTPITFDPVSGDARVTEEWDFEVDFLGTAHTRARSILTQLDKRSDTGPAFKSGPMSGLTIAEKKRR